MDILYHIEIIIKIPPNRRKQFSRVDGIHEGINLFIDRVLEVGNKKTPAQ
jgi:hypothetical protein